MPIWVLIELIKQDFFFRFGYPIDQPPPPIIDSKDGESDFEQARYDTSQRRKNKAYALYTNNTSRRWRVSRKTVVFEVISTVIFYLSGVYINLDWNWLINVDDMGHRGCVLMMYVCALLVGGIASNLEDMI